MKQGSDSVKTAKIALQMDQLVATIRRSLFAETKEKSTPLLTDRINVAKTVMNKTVTVTVTDYLF
jgi:hypothetical protein